MTHVIPSEHELDAELTTDWRVRTLDDVAEQAIPNIEYSLHDRDSSMSADAFGAKEWSLNHRPGSEDELTH